MTDTTISGDQWIRRFRSGTDATDRLVCFPHAGGSASFYFPVSQALSPGIEVMAVQYPGRQDRRSEPFIDDIDELADLVADELRPWQNSRTALFGHSMGAVLAFEVAQRLDTPPMALFASGRRAPSRYREERVHLQDDEGLIAEMRELSGTAPWVLGDEELLRLILPAVRSDYRAIETYRCAPGATVDCPIVVLTGDADPKVTLEEAEAWSEHTSVEAQVHVFPGGHFYLAEQQDEVLRVLTAHLRPGV